MAKNAGKWALGALAAGTLGYLAGILTAPKSGKETRNDLRNAANKARTEAEKKLKSLYSDLSSHLTKAKKEGAKLKGKAKNEYDDIMIKAGVAREKLRNLLSSIHEGDSDEPELQKALKEARDALKHLEKYVKG